MTFWAIDKIKNIKNSLGIPQNMKNIGSKLASLVVSGTMATSDSGNTQSHPFQQQMLFHNDKQNFSKMSAMELQNQEYHKLCQLQERIVKRFASAEEERLTKQKEKLQRQLSEVAQHIEKEALLRQKQQIYQKVRNSDVELKRILQQNIILKELIHEASK